MQVLVAATTAVGAAAFGAEHRFASQEHDFQVEVLTRDLRNPWGMAFLPDGGILISERAGRLRLYRNGKLQDEPIAGVPPVKASGQGGLLDVALHPDFETNALVYLSFAAAGTDGVGTEVVRGRLVRERLEQVETIFRAEPKFGGGRHFGSRLLFPGDGNLYITLGDRGNRNTGQDLDTHPGSVIRLRDDGSVPADNPFVNRPGARPEIYSFGHRNVQGIAVQPDSGLIWTHEHGPQGGDELNVLRAGANYGWPTITYGVNYGIGTSIGEGTSKPGMEQPRWYWVPSIAPSGMSVYSGDRFPKWRGNLFVGSLKFGVLVRLVVSGKEITHEERLLNDAYGRIRDVRTGADGYLYLLTDERRGALLRIEPAS